MNQCQGKSLFLCIKVIFVYCLRVVKIIVVFTSGLMLDYLGTDFCSNASEKQGKIVAALSPDSSFQPI